MPRTFFTSDTHFGHRGLLKPTMGRPRPFASIEAHDEALVAAWNAVVRPDDLVWHLGDFAYRCALPYAASIRARLNGRIRLVRGNHEELGERLDWEGPVVDVQRVFVQDPGMPNPRAVFCSHYSHRTWPHAHHGDLHLYGHSHGSLPGTRASLDVGVDCWNWAPVLLKDILQRMAATPDTYEAG
ncbi:UNVERIFIED_ORG: calcineurin-like phosphoesterase family protein [Methylobacterium sp. SuP10 SLI 274]|uniref:metallophosphoesterase n=1 Tax=Methylorubrum extorquens TaxID=408 RepID=UPI0020A2162C|nr:metallophosphoesterase [Methylorubrum extorquens]MDF9864164.1 calcineurin-like phosphoesterase family protein [Methylorubrum pseudosasae]MDH6637757.1 calcineurin-like phosphoesterase family protein [Methylobacterium sp. SuP10 SLI 274]MDH6666936.1 calcineurin-like phosphoesterase family protein [Methylorubrum zatmanii]MCP1558842.1 calcineurin-like phosphoesterase family protein [Methylorubrum extorquens]MDF9792476.1 calcineurin-like phosphoesterase family protein [Methylorubrum extorquens]